MVVTGLSLQLEAVHFDETVKECGVELVTGPLNMLS